jgi:hypothetical protein
LKAILKNTKAPLAYAPIVDVSQLNSGFFDDTESFFFAEVLKYLYLTFDDPSHISLDEWVFNTEGRTGNHLFHRFRDYADIWYLLSSSSFPSSRSFSVIPTSQ